MHYTQEQIAKARQTNLYEFLRVNHSNLFAVEGKSLRLKSNHSISIAPGYVGYHDFATDENGDAISFLTNYLGYCFQEAVSALLSFNGISVNTLPSYNKPLAKDNSPKEIKIPEKASGYPKRVIGYLVSQRGIDYQLVIELIERKLIYQSKDTNNVVFINLEKDFFEQRGTISDDYLKGAEPFHQVQKTKKDNFWYYTEKNVLFEDVNVIYVCEASIDAISLYDLHKNCYGWNCCSAAFVSLGGVANYETIERLIATGKKVILAVDNDSAGDKCCMRYQNLERIVGACKDWNELLKKCRNL